MRVHTAEVWSNRLLSILAGGLPLAGQVGSLEACMPQTEQTVSRASFCLPECLILPVPIPKAGGVIGPSFQVTSKINKCFAQTRGPCFTEKEAEAKRREWQA